MKDSCRGCRTAIEAREYKTINNCVIKHNAPKRKCPCEKCLVKTTCQTQCQEHIDLFKSIFQISRSYDYKHVCKNPPYSTIPIRPYYMRLRDK